MSDHVSVTEADTADGGSGGETFRFMWQSLARGSVSMGILLLTVLVTAKIGRVWLVENGPQIPSIGVAFLSVSSFSVSGSHLRGRCHIEFKMSNPDETTNTSLEEFIVSIKHGGVGLARVWVQERKSISLENRTEISLNVSMVMKASDSPKLPKKKVVFAKLEEEWRRRVVNFHVTMKVTVGFQDEDSLWRPKLLNVTCGPLEVFFAGKHKDAGRLVGIKHDCLVEITE